MKHDEPCVNESHSVANCVFHRVIPKRVDRRPRERVSMVLAHEVDRLVVKAHAPTVFVIVVDRRPTEKQASFSILHYHHEIDEHYDRSWKNRGIIKNYKLYLGGSPAGWWLTSSSRGGILAMTAILLTRIPGGTENKSVKDDLSQLKMIANQKVYFLLPRNGIGHRS